VHFAESCHRLQYVVERVLLGEVARRRQSLSLLDRAAMTYVLIGISLPSFWIALVLSYVVGFRLGWTPIAGYCEVFSVPEAANCGGVVDWAYHMILPWFALAIVQAGVYVRFVRAEVMETMTQDYVRTARAKGAPERTVMKDHILRNALLPVVTILGMDIGLLLGGAIFIETVFGLNGLGGAAMMVGVGVLLACPPGNPNSADTRAARAVSSGRASTMADEPPEFHGLASHFEILPLASRVISPASIKARYRLTSVSTLEKP